MDNLQKEIAVVRKNCGAWFESISKLTMIDLVEEPFVMFESKLQLDLFQKFCSEIERFKKLPHEPLQNLPLLLNKIFLEAIKTAQKSSQPELILILFLILENQKNMKNENS